MTMTVGGTSGLTFPDSSSQNTAATGFGFKNRIINGAMMIDQRNAGASGTANDGVFPVDRFSFAMTQSSKGTGQQSTTAPAGFVNSALFTSSSAYSVLSSDSFVFRQLIEGFNVADLGWGAVGAATVTLSFWVRSSLTGSFGVVVSNSAQNRCYPILYTISSANTWEQKTITIPGDTTGTWVTNNGLGLRINFGLGVGSTYSGTSGSWSASTLTGVTGATSVVGTNGATFYITGVQLEKGSTATSFDYRPYGTELSLCQRYLPCYSGASFSGSGGGAVGTGGFYDTTHAAIGIPFLVQARTAPTGVTVSNVGDWVVDGTTSAACTAIAMSSTSTTMAGINITYNTTTASGSFARMRSGNTSALMYFTGCEL